MSEAARAGRRGNARRACRLVVVLALLHLTAAGAHALAHHRAGVANTPGQIVFIVTVVMAAPAIAAALALRGRVAAATLLLAAALAGSFVFGLIFHYLVASPDHVAQVTGPHAALFRASAAVLAAVDGLGAALLARLASPLLRRR